MEPSNHDHIPLYKILYFVGGTRLLAELKRWGMHNISENGCGARVALRAHPTYTHTQGSCLVLLFHLHTDHPNSYILRRFRKKENMPVSFKQTACITLYTILSISTVAILSEQYKSLLKIM
jgi:hypothetical protein